MYFLRKYISIIYNYIIGKYHTTIYLSKCVIILIISLNVGYTKISKQIIKETKYAKIREHESKLKNTSYNTQMSFI